MKDGISISRPYTYTLTHLHPAGATSTGASTGGVRSSMVAWRAEWLVAEPDFTLPQPQVAVEQGALVER